LTAIADDVIEMSGLSFEAARIDNRSEVSFGSITSFRARDIDFRFTLNTGRFSASQRTVETGQ